jgi:GAF domain-containing protein
MLNEMSNSWHNQFVDQTGAGSQPTWSPEQEKLKKRALEILKEAKNRLNTDVCTFFLNQQEELNNDDWVARVFVDLGYEERRYPTVLRVYPQEQATLEPEDEKKIGLTAWVISTGETVLTDCLDTHPNMVDALDKIYFINSDTLKQANVLIVPVYDLQHQIIGAVRVERFAGKPAFVEKNQAQLEDLARELNLLLNGESFNLLKIITGLQSRLIRKLSEKISRKVILDEILEDAENLLNTDACCIYLTDMEEWVDKNKRFARMEAGRGYHKQWIGSVCDVLPPEIVPKRPDPNQRLGLTGWVISTGLSLLAKHPTDVTSHAHWLGKYDDLQLPGQDLKLAAYLAVPVRDLEGQIIGALKAERLLGKRPFSVQDQVTLEALARVVGRSISYLANIQDKAQGSGLNASTIAWALDLLQEAATSEGELDSFLDIVVQVVAATALADGCSIFLKDDTGNTRILTQRAGYGVQRLRKVIRSYNLPDAWQLSGCENIEECDPVNCPGRADLGDRRLGLTVWIAMTGKSFYAPNYEALHKHCHHRGKYDPANYREYEECGAWFGVPLRVAGDITGVLKIENKSPKGRKDQREYSLEVQRRITVLSSEIALAIERFQLQGKDRYKVIQQAKPTILEILKGGFDLPELASKVVQETAKLFNARACVLFLKDGDYLIQPDWAATGWARLGKKVRRYELVAPETIKDDPKPFEKVGLTVWIAVKRQPFQAKSNLELISHPHHRGTFDKENFQPNERCESFMGFPLLFGNELIGVFKIETKMRDVDGIQEFSYFNEQDELVFELLSSITAVAIKNVLLLEETRLVEYVRGKSIDDVFVRLCEYIQGREDVIQTLNNVAQRLNGQDDERAVFIRSFTGFIRSDFNLRILEEMKDHLTGSLQHAFEYFLAALGAENLEQIIPLRASQWELGSLLSKSFILHEPASILYAALEELSPLITRYLAHPNETLNLTKAVDLIRQQEENADYMYLLERGLLRRIFAHWHSLFVEEERKFHHIDNDYVAGPPLLPDSPVFFGRDEFFKWIQDNICERPQPNSLVLHGGWHTGKTSILKQILHGEKGRAMRERANRPIFPVFVDLQNISDPGDGMFLYKLADEIYQALMDRNVPCSEPDRSSFLATLPPVPPQTVPTSMAYDVFDKFLVEVRSSLKQRSNGILVLMLDEFELLGKRMREGKITSDVILKLRSKIQHESWMVLILVGRSRLEEVPDVHQLMFFNVFMHKEVGFLNKEDSTDLICNPVKKYSVKYLPEVIDSIFELTSGYPFFIQQICRDCIDLLNKKERDRDVTLDILEEALEMGTVLNHNDILQMLWEHESSDNDKKVLLCLADVSPDATSAKQRSQAASEILLSDDYLAEKTGLPADQLAGTLNGLKNKGLINERAGKYSMGIGILSKWIKMHAKGEK